MQRIAFSIALLAGVSLSSVAELQARAFTLDVAMVRSLGGGFTTT